MPAQVKDMDIVFDKQLRYHFIGVGGIGMSALASILLERGYIVSGSDAQHSSLLDKLTAEGAVISVGHSADNIHTGDIVVLSDAIKAENPEWQRARELGLKIIKRADVLAGITNAGRGLAVSGTHGKTSTSGMLAMILLEAKLDPTCILGGELTALHGNARNGGELTVVEACEAYNSFVQLYPEAAIVTNIEVDHLDFHGTAENMYESFRIFLRQVKSFAVVNGDDSVLRTMLELSPRCVTFGAGEGNDYRFSAVKLAGKSSFVLSKQGEKVGVIELIVPGLHNVSNATAAAALALELGVAWDDIVGALAKFPGMKRRFERLGTVNGAAIIDDYAHHPTEISAMLAAARNAFSGKLVVIFQPHLFSRTRDLLAEFANALAGADVVMLAPIYPARELPIPGVTHTALAECIRVTAPALPVITLLHKDEALTRMPEVGEGDAIIFVGAGDINQVGLALVAG